MRKVLPPAPTGLRTDDVVALVRERTGLDFPPSRLRLIEDAMQQLAEASGSRQGALVDRLRRDEAQFDAFVDRITVGETYFLREPEQCRWIRDVILAAWAGTTRLTPFRIWSAGCATGEEAYSLAMLCREAGVGDRVRVLGTDISRTALEHAAAGRYGRWSLRNTDPEWQAHYFTRTGNTWELDPSIRKMVEFRHHNLMSEDVSVLASRYDLVLCRNVLIYFDVAAMSRVSRKLLDAVALDGWLVLGASDPAIWYDHSCTVTLTGAGVAYQRAGSVTRPPAQAPAPQPAPFLPGSAAEPAPDPPRPTLVDTRGPVEPPATPEEADATPAHASAMIRSLADAGHLEEAGRVCASALKQHRLDPEIASLHASLLLAGGMPEPAIAAASRALYLDRSLVVARLTLAAGLLAAGRHGRAVQELDRILRSLASQPPSTVVPASGGATAAMLADFARAKRRLAMGGA